MKVKALRQGYYRGRHIDPGTVFEIVDKDFADARHSDPNLAKFGWMEKVEEEKKGWFSSAK